MSSEYKILCLTHDPAIVIDDNWQSGDPDDRPAVLDAARNPTISHATMTHKGCELMVGRYSSSLVELCCLGAEPPYQHTPYHRGDRWAEAGWLRLLYRGYESDDRRIVDAAGEIQAITGCWSPRRLQRLRIELGVADPDELSQEPWRSTREWLADSDRVVIDPDGWRTEDAPELDQPISKAEFVRRMGISTTAAKDSLVGVERGNLFLQHKQERP